MSKMALKWTTTGPKHLLHVIQSLFLLNFLGVFKVHFISNSLHILRQILDPFFVIFKRLNNHDYHLLQTLRVKGKT